MNEENSNEKIRYGFSVLIPEVFGKPIILSDLTVGDKKFNLNQQGSLFEVYRALCELKINVEARLTSNAILSQIDAEELKNKKLVPFADHRLLLRH